MCMVVVRKTLLGLCVGEAAEWGDQAIKLTPMIPLRIKKDKMGATTRVHTVLTSKIK